jgi:uncharacterized protein (DUF433 family)
VIAKREYIQPKLGEGVYLVKDVSQILCLDYKKVYRWIVGYWTGGLDHEISYVFGDNNNRAINFYSLIEFYTFFKLREKGVTTTEIKKLHSKLSKVLHTKYPFAVVQDYFVEQKRSKKGKRIRTFVYYTYLDSIIKHDVKDQFSFRFIEEFLKKIEFDENNLAAKFYPLADSKNVVVDPKRQFGQPIIKGTNIQTATIRNLHLAGESIENICNLYDLDKEAVEDALSYYEMRA